MTSKANLLKRLSMPGEVYCIAEIGVNHDGNVDRATELIEAARHCGADAVKFQLFDAASLLSRDALLACYQASQAADVFEMLNDLQLGVVELQAVRERARDLEVDFILTPFSVSLVPFLKDLAVDAVKIASPDCVNTPLLRASSETGLPMIISTGAATLDEVERGLDVLPDRASVALLACVSSYPTLLRDAAFSQIGMLKTQFSCPIGYSDHTQEVASGSLAVAAGATMLEKHLTYDTQADGPDHAASLTPNGLTEYIRLARETARAMLPVNQPLKCEMDVRRVSRQSVCSARELSAGRVLTAEDLTIKRPGTGIPASDIEKVVGCKLLCDVPADSVMQFNWLEAQATGGGDD